MSDISDRIRDAMLHSNFRYIVVTSRDLPRGRLQPTNLVTTEPIERGDVRPFIEVYMPVAKAQEVEERIAPLLDGNKLPSPLFLRFAIEQASKGPIGSVHRLSLIREYVEALRAGKANISSSDMIRGAAVAAIVSVQDDLHPREFSNEQLLDALKVSRNDMEFLDERLERELTPPKVAEILVQSGLIVRRMRLTFAYDPVAEYLAAWWIAKARPSEMQALRRKIQVAEDTEIGRAYREIVEIDYDY